MVEFECLKCSHCCSNLLVENNGVLKGLALTPEEINLFPTTHIFPAIGIGARGQPKKTVVFQLNLQRCPHLGSAVCQIYDKRPIACRVFPFRLEKEGILTDRQCKWYRDKIVSTGIRRKMVTGQEKMQMSDEQVESLEKDYTFSKKLSETDYWFFDMKKGIWYKPTNQDSTTRLFH